MKRNLILLIILLLFGGGAWSYFHWVYADYPQRIRQYDRTIQLRDEKLISAQIIHQQLDLVANLIEKNLAVSKSDSLAEDASLPFLKYITEILEELEIKLIKLEPGKKSARLDYVRTPYTLTLDASYKKLGSLSTDLRNRRGSSRLNSSRLITQSANPVQGRRRMWT